MSLFLFFFIGGLGLEGHEKPFQTKYFIIIYLFIFIVKSNINQFY